MLKVMLLKKITLKLTQPLPDKLPLLLVIDQETLQLRLPHRVSGAHSMPNNVIEMSH